MATPARDRQQVDSSISYDFNYVEAPPDKLTCKICQLPCREAQKSECCGHLFCKRDLEKMKAATAVSYACPICRIEPFKTYPDRAIDSEIKRLRIYCRNKEVGCGCNWSGELNQIDAHLNKCEIACEHCKEVMHYTAMIDHINECPCHCQYCGTVAERDVINDQHMEKCHKFPVPCPNTCGKDKIPQDEIASHKKECPLEMVWCEYYDIGCKSMLAREQMSAHYRDEMAKHLQYMHRVVRRLQKGNDNAEVVAEGNSHENTEPIAELLRNHTQNKEAIAKLRIDINEKYYNMIIMLVSVLVLAFAVLMGHYDEKFALVTTTGNTNQVHNDRLISLLQKNVKLQNDQLERVTKAIFEASANMETLKHYLISVLHHVILELQPSAIQVSTRLNILSELSKTVLLVRPVLKLPKCNEMIKRKENWTSSPFFAFVEGYQMCLKVYPTGIEEYARNNDVSVELYLMKGPHDDKLQQSGHWPLRGKFSISIFNHYGGSKTTKDQNVKSDVKNSRVTHDMVKIDDLTIYQFVYRDSNFDSSYCQDGNMYFTVHHDKVNPNKAEFNDTYTLNEKLSNQKSSLQHALKLLSLNNFTEEVDDKVAPCNLKLSGFSEIEVGDPWYSSPFFAFEGGYQIRLKVVKDRDCLISLELFLMKGPNDEKLQILGWWPLRGTFTVKLLGNNKYYPSSVLLDEEICTQCFKRVTENDIASEGFGFSIFKLESFCTKPNFFKDDALFFEIFYNKHTSYDAAA